MKLTNNKNQAGFTIIELIIATLVFSVILLIIMTAVLQITRSYYKGVNTTKTQETARNIMTIISEAIQFSGGVINTNLPDASDGSDGFCVDHYRFSYITEANHVYNGTNTDHGLVMDDVGPRGCESGVAVDNPDDLDELDELTAQELEGRAIPGDVKGKELLASRMKSEITITEVDGSKALYQVTVRIALGEGDLLSGDSSRCLGGHGGQFCAVTTLTNLVQKRVQ